MFDIITILNKKTKTELVDLFEEMINNQDLSPSTIEKYITAEEMSSQEQALCEKLKANLPLDAEEKDCITQRLAKRSNAKISTILAGNKKFDAWLVNFKLGKYFEIAWVNYPRKIGKELGRKAFINLLKGKKLADLDAKCQYALVKIKKYKDMCEENETEEQFILHFSTFCNSKKYL